MCNAYTLKRDLLKRMKEGEKIAITEAIRHVLWEGGRSYTVRPTLPAPVLRPDGEGRLMRWGFERPWAKSINNARVEKRGTMWKKAWREGRCLIPMSGWFEFTGPSGRMTCHLLEAAEEPAAPDEPPLLAAGLWETHPDHGDCYTMVMCEAPPDSMLGRIHNRMPILLTPEAGREWLARPPETLEPSPISIRESIVPSPLKRAKPEPPGPAQGELL